MTTPRRRSASGFYHVMLRGNGKQLLFEDDGDREAFLLTLSAVCKEANIDVIAWCLMDNHVHLLLADDRGNLSEAMRELAARFARRFNVKSGHVGHVFQDRFQSVPIESNDYLLQAVLYIHNNPAKAGVCSTEGYLWSSYREYLGCPVITRTDVVLDMLGGPDGFREFCEQSDGASYQFCAKQRVPDEHAVDVSRMVLGNVRACDVKGLSRVDRNEALRRLRGARLTIPQIVRLTGIGESTIKRATR